MGVTLIQVAEEQEGKIKVNTEGSDIIGDYNLANIVVADLRAILWISKVLPTPIKRKLVLPILLNTIINIGVSPDGYSI